MLTDYLAQKMAIEDGVYSDPDPAKCRCHGGGWIATSFDTWERCPMHDHNGRHPEDPDPEDPEDCPSDDPPADPPANPPASTDPDDILF